MRGWRDRRHLEPDSGCPGSRSRGYKETGCRSNWLELQSEKRRHQVKCRAPLKPVRGRLRESKLPAKPQAPGTVPPASLSATWFDPPRIEIHKIIGFGSFKPRGRVKNRRRCSLVPSPAIRNLKLEAESCAE